MTEANLEHGQAAKKLPVDLRHWVDECRLIMLALEAAQRVFSRTAAVGMPANVALNPQMMLTLLTYSYAAGMHASEDIEWASLRDLAMRYICAGSFPDCQAIRRFRRANRQMIEHGLVHVFTEARKLRFAGTGQWEVEDPGFAAQTYASILEVVRRKLQLAVMMDTAAAE